jgi:hypothetical protein
MYACGRRSWAVPNLMRLVTGFRKWRPRFNPRSGLVGFVVDTGAVLLRVLWFPLPLVPLTVP